MVETITPVVHGGSRSRWGISSPCTALGAAAAAIVGSLLAGAARCSARRGVPGAVLVAAAAALYVARELGAPVPVPQLRRQVPDWWRTFFPPHVAAFLYGLGLGPGFLTYLGHGTFVVVSVAAFASGRPLLGAAVLAPFGLARGLGPVLAFGVRSPNDAAALVERLDRSASRPAGGSRTHSRSRRCSWRPSSSSAGSMAPSEVGALAAATLALTFGAAAIAKLARRAAWGGRSGRTVSGRGRRGSPGSGFPPSSSASRRSRSPGSGRRRDSSIVALVAFSGAIVLGRVRAGRRLDGCFAARAPATTGCCSSQPRARRGGVRRVEGGEDAPLARSLGEPAGADLLPVALVVLGLALAVWVGAVAFAGVGRRSEG